MVSLDLRDADDLATNSVRERILAAAAVLLEQGGSDALTTRSVATAAGVQAPTIYRLFGDKRGLLDAVAERGLATYVENKTALATDPDPIDDFRAGWDRHIAFGLANPALFGIIYGDPQPGRSSPAQQAGQAALRAKVRAVAAAGLLSVDEVRAAEMMHSAGVGVVLTLLGQRPEERDHGLSDATREAVISSITTGAAATARFSGRSAAIALKASLPEIEGLSPGERHLLDELLERISREPRGQ